MTVRTASTKQRVSLDRSIERMRKQLAELATYLGKGIPTRNLEEFDLDTERLIGDLLGQTSDLLHAYEYAELGEAAGLVNMTDEAPESGGMDDQRNSILQRSRVLESCVSELEAPRGGTERSEGHSSDSDRTSSGGAHDSRNPESLARSQPSGGGTADAEMETWFAPSDRRPVVRRLHHGFDSRARGGRQRRQREYHTDQSVHAQAGGCHCRRSSDYRCRATYERAGHQARCRYARRTNYRCHIGLQYSAVLLGCCLGTYCVRNVVRSENARRSWCL